MDKLNQFVMKRPHHTREIEEMRDRKMRTVEWRYCEVTFKAPGSDTIHKRIAVWEWSNYDRDQIGKDYNGFFFIKLHGVYYVCQWFTGQKSAVVIDSYPYTHRTIREAFHDLYRMARKQRA